MKLNNKGVAALAVIGIVALSLLAVAAVRKGVDNTVKSVTSVVQP